MRFTETPRARTRRRPTEAARSLCRLCGPGGAWQICDWAPAISGGMKTAGLPYSGKFGWVETDMYWKVNHVVVPKDKALACEACHSERGRLDWKALGYDGDPDK